MQASPSVWVHGQQTENLVCQQWVNSARHMPDALVLALDCRGFYDPAGNLDHIGSHPENLASMIGHHKDELTSIFRRVSVAVNAAQQTARTLQVLLYCKSGRHRSVGMAVILAYALSRDPRVSGCITAEHLNELQWAAIRNFCGARACRF